MIDEPLKEELKKFFTSNKSADIVSTYLFFIERKHKVAPVLYVREKVIYQNIDHAIEVLSQKNKIWKEVEIKVGTREKVVNQETKKIYICPYSGKVFGDNTCANPQDAIYDWVSRCPENQERPGLKVKRFYVSDDPEVIKNYIYKEDKPKSFVKTVYTSQLSGRLFNSKESVISDFKENYLKFMTLNDVQSQNRFKIEESFLSFIQQHLCEDRITQFIETLTTIKELSPFVSKWLS